MRVFQSAKFVEELLNFVYSRFDFCHHEVRVTNRGSEVCEARLSYWFHAQAERIFRKGLGTPD